MGQVVGVRDTAGVGVSDTVSEQHFAVLGDAVGPQPWMQLRSVGTIAAVSVAKSYAVSDGTAKNDVLQSLVLSWTNNTPLPQRVYGMVTTGGRQVTLQTRSRAHLDTAHGYLVTDVGDALPVSSAIPQVVVSQFGTGADVGVGGTLSVNTAFCVAELRQNAQTVPLMPHLPGMILVLPGQSITAKVATGFKSDFWENGAINGGTSGTESKFVSGDLRLDLFALPAVTPPTPRATPSIPGGVSNCPISIEWNTVLGGTVMASAKPTGLAAGDQLLAIVTSQFGGIGDIGPSNGSWTEIHQRDAGEFDVHMRIFVMPVPDPTLVPATLTFSNGFPVSEAMTVVIPLRGAGDYTDTGGSGWAVASNLSAFLIVDDQVAPSIQRHGQMLIAASYFNHSPFEGDIVQSPPPGMTEVRSMRGAFSTEEVAYLVNPPYPTLDRKFTPSRWPTFFGHTIAAAILIPGAQT